MTSLWSPERARRMGHEWEITTVEPHSYVFEKKKWEKTYQLRKRKIQSKQKIWQIQRIARIVVHDARDTSVRRTGGASAARDTVCCFPIAHCLKASTGNRNKIELVGDSGAAEARRDTHIAPTAPPPHTVKKIGQDACRNRSGGDSCECGVQQPRRWIAGTGIRNWACSGVSTWDRRASVMVKMRWRAATYCSRLHVPRAFSCLHGT